MINKVILVGRMVADPEVRYTQSGIAVARLRIAVERPFKNANGEKQTDFINAVAWRKLAELCGQYLKKGQMAAIDGSLQMNQWEQEGQKRTTYEVLADNVQFLDRGGSGGAGGTDSPQFNDADAPPPPDNSAPAGGEVHGGDPDLPF